MLWCKETCLLEARNKRVKKYTSCSGILIHPKHRFIITHSTLMLPFCNQNTLKEVDRHGFLSGKLFPEVEIRATLQKKEKINKTGEIGNRPLNIHGKETSLPSVVLSSQMSSAESDLQHIGASVVLMWKAGRFAKTLNRLMPKSDGWKLTDDETSGYDRNKKEQETTMQEDIAYKLLPCFVLLKLNDKSDVVRFTETDALLGDLLCRGMGVTAVGTPFGNLSPDIFLNCVSSGILCNLVGSQNELLLNDARCLPGSEGGALYSSVDGRQVLAGMIISPLCWKNNEWVGLAVGCSMSEILDSLQDVTEQQDFAFDKYLIDRHSGKRSRLISHLPVVLVQYGITWGTGILLNEGLVITCAHVIKFNKKARVEVRVFVSDVPMWLNGTVLFSSPEGAVFDAAIIQLSSKYKVLRSPEWKVANVKEGMPVYMIGHGLFGERHGLKPSITKGNVAKVTRVNGTPAIVQSTCAVSAGASGGPLVDELGRLVGMVTCNAKNKEADVTFPHINMAVPATVFWPILQEFLCTKDLTVLSRLHIRDEEAEKLWNLTSGQTHLKSLL